MAKKELQKLIESIKTKQFREGEAKGLIESIQEEQTKALKPVLEGMAKEIAQSAKEAVQNALAEIKIEQPNIDIPPVEVDVSGIEDAIRNIQINVPETKFPNIPAPVVNVPQAQVNIPDRFYAETELSKVDYKRPLPVRLYDADGKPFAFPVAGGGMGGGKADYWTIKTFEQSAFAELMNPDGRLKVELPSGASGLTDTELRASAVPVSQVSDASWSVAVKEIFGSAIASLLNGDNRIPVSVETGGSGLTDAELRASSVPVAQASGANWSVSVTDVFGSTGANVINPDGRIKVELPSGASGLTDTELRASSVPVEQVSGSIWSTQLTIGGSPISTSNPVPIQPPASGSLAVSATDLDIRDLTDTTDSIRAYQVSGASYSVTVAGATGTLGANIVDSTGVGYSGSNPFPITGTVTGITNSVAVVNLDRDGNPKSAWLVSDITASVKAALIDSTGVQYSGSNPVPTYLVASSGNSTVSVGDLASDAADTGSAPVKIGGIARTANPTAVAAGDRVSATFDDLGRQVVRNHQVRDLIRTAYATLSTNTETTLLAGASGVFHDLVYIKFSNTSSGAVTVDLRSTTAGSIVDTYEVPANAVVGIASPLPYPVSDAGTWTLDYNDSDLSNTTVYVSALFSAEV